MRRLPALPLIQDTGQEEAGGEGGEVGRVLTESYTSPCPSIWHGVWHVAGTP